MLINILLIILGFLLLILPLTTELYKNKKKGFFFLFLALSFTLIQIYKENENSESEEKIIQEKKELQKNVDSLNINIKNISDSLDISKKLIEFIYRNTNTIKSNFESKIDKDLHDSQNEKNNIFIHFQKEIEENITKSFYDFRDSNILGFMNTNKFINSRYENEYIKKYGSISSKEIIINHLKETSDLIKKINYDIDIYLKTVNSENRNLMLRQIIKLNRELRPMLKVIYERIYFLNTFQEYESTNFDIDPVEIDDKELEIGLGVVFLLKHNKDFRLTFLKGKQQSVKEMK